MIANSEQNAPPIGLSPKEAIKTDDFYILSVKLMITELIFYYLLFVYKVMINAVLFYKVRIDQNFINNNLHYISRLVKLL